MSNQTVLCLLGECINMADNLVATSKVARLYSSTRQLSSPFEKVVSML